MKRLIPDSIAGRTLGVLLLGLTASHVVSVGLYSADRDSLLVLAGGKHMAERVVTITDMVERTAPAERQRIAELADGPWLRVMWSTGSAIADDRTGGWQAGALRNALRSHLADAGERDLRVRYTRSHWPGPWAERAPPTDPRPESGGLLLVSLPLRDGGWMNFAAPVEVADALPSHRFLLSLVLMVAAIVVLSALVVHHLIAPLRVFARAAERLGVDVHAPPLPETGPVEVRRATRAFNEMQERIRRFVDDRTQMLAAISHDLRTPIMRLRLRAEFIEDEEEQKKTLADLDDMERMIASTLSFARDDIAGEARETVDLVALVQRVCDRLEDTGLAVEFEQGARLAYTCRPGALRRALTNLIENAATYGGRARVALIAHAGAVVVRIDDDGPGVPDEQRENVFKPFFRLEGSRNRDTGGTGLGLTVARTVVHAHGGAIHLGNRPEGGLRVEVTLPR